jgi:hypothetical protein
MRSPSFIFLFTLVNLFLGSGILAFAEPLRLHPANSRYAEFRGEPILLVGSSEHYGAVVNLDFDYIRYLEETRACNLNIVRVFSGAYVEVEGAFNIEDNTLAPRSGRFIAPWARSDQPGAADGGNKFDLTQWNPAYFHRLKDFVKEAGKRDIIVELTLFCPFYSMGRGMEETLWLASPMNGANHINNVGFGNRFSCYQAGSDLLPFHLALTRKCAEELAGFDNAFIEVMNEPYQPEDAPVPMDWQNLIADELVAAQPNPATRLLIAQNIANYEQVIVNPHPAVSIFNFHYALPQAALANLGLNKLIGNDETGFAGSSDLSYRRECWLFMLAGGGLVNHLDFAFTDRREDGIGAPKSPGGGGPSLRRQLGILHWFMKELPFTRCSPLAGFVSAGVPANAQLQAFGVEGEAYGLYLSGPTAISLAQPTPNQATLTANLPEGEYAGRWIDPRSGNTVQNIATFIHAGGGFDLVTPAYGDDVAMLLFRRDVARPQLFLTSPHYQSVVGSDAAVTAEASLVLPDGVLQQIEFFNNGDSIGTDDSEPYSLALPPLEKGLHIIRAKATTADGRESWAPPVKVLVVGASETGINLNGLETELNGKTWQSNAQAVSTGMLLGTEAAALTSETLPLYPVLEGPIRNLMATQFRRNSSTATAQLTVSYPLPTGEYDVFVKLVETEVANSRDVEVLIEGVSAARRVGDLALGEWVNYGPYRTSVTDGTLNIGLRNTVGASSGKLGRPFIAGVSAYRVEAATPVSETTLDISSGSGVAVVSVPASVPLEQIEAATTLDETADWLPITLPFSDFGDRRDFVVPATRPSQFFRLRLD